MVEQMSGRWQIKHPDMRPLAAEARSLLPPGRVSYTWIPRAENKHADRLANEAMDAGQRGERWEPGRSTAELAAQDASSAVRSGSGGADAARPTAPAVGWAAPRTWARPRPSCCCGTGRRRSPAEAVLRQRRRRPELSPAGRRQAELTAAALAARGTVQAVVSSPLRRARETAAAVAAGSAST
ncbi:histidine phosphatase family protein [Streptomyces sp. M19]